MMKGGHGQTTQLHEHDINYGPFDHASHQKGAVMANLQIRLF